MTLQQQIAADQAAVFFSDFSVQVELNGDLNVEVLLADMLGEPGGGEGIVVLRQQLQVEQANIGWLPISGKDITVNGEEWTIEKVGGGPDQGADVPWLMILKRFTG